MLVDTHCHLNMNGLLADLAGCLRRAEEAGVRQMIVVGSDIENSRVAVDLALRYPQLFAAVGIHPHEAHDCDVTALERLRGLAAAAGCATVVAIGETGLDYYRNLSPRKSQQEAFRQELTLARELDLPIIVHSRDAMVDTLQALVSGDLGGAGGVLHCFSGDIDACRQALDLGLYISLAGPVTFKNAGRAREVACYVPLDRLLVETDAPYLSPAPFRGQTNEPARVRLVAEALAEIRGLDPAEVFRITADNARRLFRLPHPT